MLELILLHVYCLNHHRPAPATFKETEISLKHTMHWVAKGKRHYDAVKDNYAKKRTYFAIVQGGFYPELRQRAVNELLELGFDDFAIGGVSVGEPPDLLLEQ